MSFNSFGHVFRFSTWGESHGPAIGAMVDGCPPGIKLSEADLQPWLDKRRPGTSRASSTRPAAALARQRGERTPGMDDVRGLGAPTCTGSAVRYVPVVSP